MPLTLLAGCELEFVQLDHAIVLGFSGDRKVVIEAVAHLEGPHGPAVVDPGADPSDALSTLLGDTVEMARTGESGELWLSFTSGALLRVDTDPEVEAWAVTGPDGFLIVCMARGELAVWGSAAG
jgi:hypothetical protein